MSVQMKAGFARTDITPPYAVPLAGYGNPFSRISKVVLDPLLATCVAVSDGDTAALFFHLDLCGFPNASVTFCKETLEEKLGIPQDQMTFTATHNHSAPDLSCGAECIKTYIAEILHPRLIALAVDALDDLDDATLSIGSGKAEGLNFVRRYLLSDGSYGGDNFGDFVNNTILAHETEADPTMQLVCWNRANKKDIVMVNWQSHPHRTGGSAAYDLSSDLIHHFRMAAEEAHNIHFAYYQGCAGNINSHSRVEEENTPEYYQEGTHRDYVGHGHRLAKVFSTIMPTLRPVKTGKIIATSKIFEGKVNHETDCLVDKAMEVDALWKSNQLNEARELAVKYGFNSVYHCFAVIGRSKLPETHSYRIGAIAVGDFAFVWAPNELYDTTGIYLKAVSPFELTYVCGYTNGAGNGYMPTIKAFAHGGYGCDTCKFPSGTAEILANELLELLVQLYKQGRAG